MIHCIYGNDFLCVDNCVNRQSHAMNELMADSLAIEREREGSHQKWWSSDFLWLRNKKVPAALINIVCLCSLLSIFLQYQWILYIFSDLHPATSQNWLIFFQWFEEFSLKALQNLNVFKSHSSSSWKEQRWSVDLKSASHCPVTKSRTSNYGCDNLT